MKTLTVMMALVICVGVAEAKSKKAKRRPASISAKSVVTTPLYNKRGKHIGTKFIDGKNVCYKYSGTMSCMKK